MKKFLTLKMKSVEALEFLECYSSTKVKKMGKMEFPELMTLELLFIKAP